MSHQGGCGELRSDEENAKIPCQSIELLIFDWIVNFWLCQSFLEGAKNIYWCICHSRFKLPLITPLSWDWLRLTPLYTAIFIHCNFSPSPKRGKLDVTVHHGFQTAWLLRALMTTKIERQQGRWGFIFFKRENNSWWRVKRDLRLIWWISTIIAAAKGLSQEATWKYPLTVLTVGASDTCGRTREPGEAKEQSLSWNLEHIYKKNINNSVLLSYWQLKM